MVSLPKKDICVIFAYREDLHFMLTYQTLKCCIKLALLYDSEPWNVDKQMRKIMIKKRLFYTQHKPICAQYSKKKDAKGYRC